MRRLVPDLILQNLARKQYKGQFEAVCLFVDTSGFTPLTNALMAHGTEGAEAIADALVNVFTPLVQIVYEQGGYIASFAGDAFKAIFPLGNYELGIMNYENVASPDDFHNSYLRAVAAAWQIRQHMAQQPAFSTRFGDFDFGVKVTIGDGAVDWGIWRGDRAKAAQNALYYFEGEALAHCLEADPFADVGEVIMTQAVYDQLPAGAVTASQIDSYRQLTGVSHELLAACPPLPLTETAVDETLASAFFPIDLLHLPIRGEFRQVVTLFINLQSLPAGESFPRTLFRLLKQYGGYLCRAGRIGDQDKGGTLLLFWGAPHSHENDVARVLHFILDLQAAVTTPLKAGITTGMAYAGFIGSSRREEYTCHGVYVNLAARQMVAAGWNEIWLDEESAGRAERAFDLVAKGRHHFKGFAEMRPVFLLRGWQEVVSDIFYRGRLVGRDRELAQLEAAVRPLNMGHFGGILTISGEAGIGKSRLVHEFLTQLPKPGFSEKPSFSVFLAQTDEILRRSLNPFRYFLRHYFNQAPTASEAANKWCFNQKVDDLIAATTDADLEAELQRARSFLGALVDLHWPDSLYAQLEPKLRFENTLAGLKALVKAESRRQPVILHLEDAHWLDTDSRAFLAGLTRNVADYPFLIVATTRPPQTEGVETTLTVPEEAAQTTIHLAPLSPAALEALAAARLDGPVAPELVDLLAERAEGNPFFAEQILLYLQEQALISRNGRGWELKNGARPNGSLPADVRSLLVARLDRLPLDVRQVVQAASVLGREFAIQVLNQMLFEDQALMDKVKAAVAAAIWAALSDVRYLFQHTLLRDAAYEMQLQTQRRWLHRLAAAAIEILYNANLAPYYAELAYHTEQAELVEKACAYWEKAGDVASEAYQNTQAIDYYTRALALTTVDTDRYRLLLSREKVYDLQGAREAQGQDLALLESLAEALGDRKRQAEVAVRRSHHARVIDDEPAALTASQTAVRLAQSGRSVDLEAAGYLEWARALMRQGDLEAIQDRLKHALTLARSVDLRQVEAHSLSTLGIASYRRSGDLQRAKAYFEQALQIYREIGNRKNEAGMLSNLGFIAAEGGDYALAGAYYEQALAIDREIGNKIGASATLINLGAVSLAQGVYAGAQAYFEWALPKFREAGERAGESMALICLGRAGCHQGDYSGARACFEQALSICQEIGFRSRGGIALNYLGAVACKQGDFISARDYHEQALGIFRDIGDRVNEGYASTYLGEALLSLGHLTRATTAFEQAMTLREELGQKHLAVESRAGLARAALARGDLSRAHSHVEMILDYLQTNTLDGTEEPFQIYLTCHQVLQANRDARAEEILNIANNLLQERAAKIGDEATRRSFLDNVAVNRQIIAEWEQLNR
ncbi:MAG TPA: tetratricopeptide repeat protein [Anaerolineae bacterium]